MSDKTLKTRIQHKRGTTNDWSQATNFIPLDGELIIYNEKDGTSPKFKVGDGTTLVGNLPFATNENGGGSGTTLGLTIDLNDAEAGIVPTTNSDQLGGIPAAQYALKTDTAANAEKLGGVAANDYALKTDTVANATKLGGKDAAFYIQPYNHFDNSYFINLINQRGQTTYEAPSGAPYNIDRWYANRATISVGNSEIIVSRNTTASTSSTYFGQKIDNVSRFVGLPLTVAFMTNKGLIMGSFTFTGENADIASAYGWEIAYSKTASSFVIQTTTEESITIKWACLYEGTYTAETLPPYMPKGYAAELAECQRYYENSWFGTGKDVIPIYSGVIFNTSSLDAFIPLKTHKRVIPTVLFNPNEDGAVSWRIYHQLGYRNISSIAITRATTNCILCRVKKDTTNDDTTWTPNTAATITGHWEASADL